MTSTTARLSSLQIAVILLTIFTALVHLGLGLSTPDIMFILNGLGYFALVGALYLPIPQLSQYHALIRWALIAFAVVTIIGWIAIGDKTLVIGYPTKAAEVVLIGLLLVEARQK